MSSRVVIMAVVSSMFFLGPEDFAVLDRAERGVVIVPRDEVEGARGGFGWLEENGLRAFSRDVRAGVGWAEGGVWTASGA
jgi:hypothetical protein